MIDHILQIEGQNVLQVVYDSGCNRFVKLDGYGNYKLTKSQRKFMNNSNYYEMKDATKFGDTIYFWLDKANPNKGILSQIELRNKIHKKRTERGFEDD